MKKIYMVAGVILIVVFLVSFFVFPQASQTLIAPSKVTCDDGTVRVRLNDDGIRSGQIETLAFSHDSSVILNSVCADTWANLRDNQITPIVDVAVFKGIDIIDFVSASNVPPGIGIGWTTEAVVDQPALRDWLYEEHGILDSGSQTGDYDAYVVFYEGACLSDDDCGSDEYCVTADKECQELLCDDNDICTTDYAENHECVYDEIPDCCVTSDDCPEDKVCKSNVCTLGCKTIPEKPCGSAVWIDYPSCEWDTASCDAEFWALVVSICIILAMLGGFIFTVWWLRFR